MRELNQSIIHLQLPEKMKRLPIDERGFPVPYFVPWIKGEDGVLKPEFRGMDGERFAICVRLKRCWLCGQPLGAHQTFVVGPMCGVNRNTAEPPCHHSCATYAAQACPFLTQPRMRRNEKDMPAGDAAGLMIKRNPGVTLLWTTKGYKLQRSSGGTGVLFTIGPPEKVEWFAEGRAATRDEIMHSVETGMPLLRRECQDAGEHAVLDRMVQAFLPLVPA
jgi:hypothetical protein